MDLDIKIKNGKFWFGLFNKKKLISVSVVRMQYMPNNVLFSTVYSKASSKPKSLFTAIKPRIACVSRQGISIEN